MKLLKIVTTLIIGMFGIFTLCSCGDKDGKETTEKQGVSDLFEDDVIVKYEYKNKMYSEKSTLDKFMSKDGVDWTSFTYPISYGDSFSNKGFEISLKAKKDFTINNICFEQTLFPKDESLEYMKEYLYGKDIFYIFTEKDMDNVYPAKCDNLYLYLKYGLSLQIGNEITSESKYNYSINKEKNAYKDTYYENMEEIRTDFEGNTVPKIELFVNTIYNHSIKQGEYLFISFLFNGFSCIGGDVTQLETNKVYEDRTLWSLGPLTSLSNVTYYNLSFEEE